jgi:hypothetical protein
VGGQLLGENIEIAGAAGQAVHADQDSRIVAVTPLEIGHVV